MNRNRYRPTLVYKTSRLSSGDGMVDAGPELGERHQLTRRDRIVIGGSAGSLDTLQAIARHFPSEFSGTIFVVAHIGQSRSTLPDLLRKSSNLSASHPRGEEPIREG